MAENVAITDSDDWFIGEDKTFPVTVLNKAQTAAIDIAGWSLSWIFKRRVTDVVALLTKTTSAGIGISGTFNATPSINTQLATVTVLDTDTDVFTPGVYYYEVKRSDANLETVVVYGSAVLKRAGHTS